MSPQKSSKQYRSVSRCASKFYQVKTNDLSTLAHANGRARERRRQRRYRGQNPTWIYIRDVWQSWNLFGSGSKFLFYVLLILSTIIGLLIYQSFLNADVTNEQPNASPSEKSVSSTIDSKQCFDGDVCMIPTNYMFV